MMELVSETQLPYPRGDELSDDGDYTALVDEERNLANFAAADPIYATDEEEDDPEPPIPDVHDGITDAVPANAETDTDDDIASDMVNDGGNVSHRYDAEDAEDSEDDPEDDPEPPTPPRVNAVLAPPAGSHGRRRFAHPHPLSPPGKLPRLS